MSDTINNHEDLFDHVGEEWDPVDVSGSEQRLSRRVYKSTECGAWAKLDGEIGVRAGSIVEGSDAEVGPETLLYPFTVADWDAMFERIGKEADALWDEANEHDDDEED